MFLIYNLLSLLSLIAYLPWLLSKKGPENRLQYLKERLGISEYTNADLWIHAVSVGEVMAALPFLASLKKEFPGIKIVLSTTTYTGQKIAREKFPSADRIMYIPWDTWLTIRKAVRAIKPKIFITIETELWPALFSILKKNGSCIVLLNGRISPESFKGYKLIKPFMKKVLSYLDFIYMQGETDAERIIAIGADKNEVGIMGNFKFDIELDKKESVRWMDGVKGKILLAGSTHKGEEEMVLDAYEEVKKSFPDLKLILAPRHPERFNEAEELLKKRNLNFIRRTELIRAENTEHRTQSTDNPPFPPLLKGGEGGLEPPDIILLDSIGELSRLFSGADVTFIGGSLLPFGGHNILEPAYWGKPSIFGPHMENFPIAKDFLMEGAAIMVKDPGGLAAAIKDLLENTEKAEHMGQKAKGIIDKNTGAVKKAVALVRSFLGNS